MMILIQVHQMNLIMKNLMDPTMINLFMINLMINLKVKTVNNNNNNNNNKSLIVCYNYALLDFYLCHFRRYDSVKKFNCV